MEFWINVSKNDINSILLFNLKKMKDSKFIEIFKDPKDETFFLYDLIIIKTSIYLDYNSIDLSKEKMYKLFGITPDIENEIEKKEKNES